MNRTGSNESHTRYVLVVLLFFHAINAYMDRICMSAACSAIQSDLQITDQGMGYVFGVFALGYALFQAPAGWFADIVGPKKALTLLVTIWSFFIMVTGAVRNAASMLIIQFLFGASEAGTYPGATRAMYNWIPAKERGFANGVFHSGSRIGAALSLLILPLIIQWMGWRLTFVFSGTLGIIWVVIWNIWFKDHPRQHPAVTQSELQMIEAGIRETGETLPQRPFKDIIKTRNMILNLFQYMVSNITFIISYTWLLPYLEDQYGGNSKLLAPIPLFIGAAAHWFSGIMMTNMHKKGHWTASRRIPAATGFLLGALGLILLTQIRDLSPLAFVLFFGIAVFGVEMTISPSWSFCMDIGGENTGIVSGSMNMLGNIGSAVSAVIFPFFVAHVTFPYFAEKTGTGNSFFILAAALNITAMIAWMFMDPKKQ